MLGVIPLVVSTLGARAHGLGPLRPLFVQEPEEPAMRTSIYVDGFNLYYGAVKGTPYKWLDLKAVFAALLQRRHEIVALKYFTARVSGKRHPQQPIRQQTYWRALQAWIPEFTLYEGTFLTHPVRSRLVEPIDGREFATVLKTEEKGSDVNLAVHLLNDAWLGAWDCAVVVSNDSDLAEAMRLIRTQHPDKTLGLVFPRHRGHPSRELVQHAHFVKHLSKRLLATCQLPDPIPGTRLRKPVTW